MIGIRHVELFRAHIALKIGSLSNLDGYGYKQNDFHFNTSMKSHIMNIS